MARKKQPAAPAGGEPSAGAAAAKPDGTAAGASEPQAVVDLTEVRETSAWGPSAFASEDIAPGQAVLTEEPLLEAALASEALGPSRSAELARASEVAATGGGPAHLLPDRAVTQDVGLLDAFVAAPADVRVAVLHMQHAVDETSPLAESARLAASFVHGQGMFAGLDADTIERVILVGKVNAYAFGKDRQALLARGRFVAHSCQPNCVFVAERVLRDGEQKMYGSFRAVRDIAKGELLTSSYAADDFAATSRDQRRKHLLCQKGFLCCCGCCAEDAASEDRFDCWPCPRCRPRQPDGDLPEDRLAGCRALRAAGRSPAWRAECGACFSDEEVIPEGGRALEREALMSVYEPPKDSTAASRNAFLARVLRRLGEAHSATQALLRTVALRAVASAQSLEPTVQHVDRCHEFLVSAGWPLGMMPTHSLYRALISRAQAEVKARSPVSTVWLKLIGDATACAVVVEGADSETARTGLVVTKLLATMARGGGGGGSRAGAAE